jgi:hypothetical protein
VLNEPDSETRVDSRGAFCKHERERRLLQHASRESSIAAQILLDLQPGIAGTEDASLDVNCSGMGKPQNARHFIGQRDPLRMNVSPVRLASIIFLAV